MTTASLVQPPDLLDFHLVERIGRGSMGSVYRAERTGDRRAYVVKILEDVSPDTQRDLVNEARVLWSVGHPLVRLPVLFGQHRGRPVLVLELVPGQPLQDLPADRDLAERVLRRVGATLRSVHAAGIVHGDLKPGNLIVDPRGDIHLIDFGLSRRTRSHYADALGTSDAVGGTLGYTPMEVWEEQRITPAVDWYGLGAVVHELLTGATPELGCTLRADDGALEAAVVALLDPDPETRADGETLAAWFDDLPSLPTPPFEGRVEEIEELREWVDLPGSGVFVVYGPPEAGKSRLVREALHDGEVLATRCYGFETRAFTGLDWMTAALGEPTDAAAWVAQKVEETGSVPGAAIAAREALAAEADHLVVFLEDAHHLDEDALAFLRVLLAAGDDLDLKLVLEVPDHARTHIDSLTSLEAAERWGYDVSRVELEPLGTAPATDQLLARVLPHLTDAELAMLEVLAVHEPGLWPTQADEIVLQAGTLTPPSLQRLRRIGAIADRSGRLFLSHPALREAVCSRITPARQRLLRELVLEHLEDADYPEEERIPHLAALGEARRARNLATQAAQAARSKGAFDHAITWYQRALTWNDEPEQEPSLQQALARCLESSGRVREAADRWLTTAEDDRRLHAARCLFDAGAHEEALEVLAPDLSRHRVSVPRSVPGTALRILGGLAWLLLRGLRDREPPPDREDAATRLSWLVARGSVVSEAALCLAMSLDAVRLGLRGGDRRRAGRALAFVGGGVFLQAPGLRRWSGRCLQLVRSWASDDDDLLEVSATLWTAMADLSQGRWRAALEALDRVEPRIDGREGAWFEQFVARQAHLIVHQHHGHYRTLLDRSMREVEHARRRGEVQAELIFLLLAVDGYLAAGRLAPVRHALGRVQAALPDRFVPQTFYLVEAEIHLALAEGDPQRASAAWHAMQKPFRRAGGEWAAVTRIRNAVLAGRIGLHTGDEVLLDHAVRRLHGMERPDAEAYIAWITAARAPDGSVRHASVAEALERGDAGALALAVRMQGGDDGAGEALRALGVSDPGAWSRWMVPLGGPR